MSLEYAILGFLREQPMTGYDLKTVCFDHDAQHFWTADQAQIYRTLDRLEERGLVDARIRRQRSRPDRKVYSITRAGTEVLDRWAAVATPLPPLRDPFLIQLRFSDQVGDEELLDALRTRRELLQERLETLRSRAAAEARGVTRAAVLHRLTLDAALADTRARIDWLDDALETISTLIEQERTSPGGQPQLFASSTAERGTRS